jgi:L-ascorbate metabolism protein UlaG (beta-lactamase superfamily)
MQAAHVNPEEAVQAHLALEAQWSVGMHFGTFQLTDEGIEPPLEALADARQQAGVSPDQFGICGFGETRLFPLGVRNAEKAVGSRPFPHQEGSCG